MATNDDDPSSSYTYGQYGTKKHMSTMENYVTREQVIKEQRKAVDVLPTSKRWPFDIADTYLALYGGTTSLITTSFLRRMLMIRKGALLMSVPVAIATAGSIKIGWLGAVTTPILAGELQCSLCGEMRGGLVNFGLGAVYPMLISLPLATAFATYGQTIDLPQLKEVVTNWPKFSKFWIRKLSFFKVQFISLSLFQVAMGVFIAERQMDVCNNKIKSKFTRVKMID